MATDFHTTMEIYFTTVGFFFFPWIFIQFNQMEIQKVDLWHNAHSSITSCVRCECICVCVCVCVHGIRMCEVCAL